METAEQKARDMLERMGVEDAQSWTSGDVVELANLIADRNPKRKKLKKVIADQRDEITSLHFRLERENFNRTKSELTPKFKAAIFEGKVPDLVGKSIGVVVDRVFGDWVTLSFKVVDQDGDALVHLCRIDVKEGNTLNVMNIDRAFNVTLTE